METEQLSLLKKRKRSKTKKQRQREPWTAYDVYGEYYDELCERHNAGEIRISAVARGSSNGTWHFMYRLVKR